MRVKVSETETYEIHFKEEVTLEEFETTIQRMQNLVNSFKGPVRKAPGSGKKADKEHRAKAIHLLRAFNKMGDGPEFLEELKKFGVGYENFKKNKSHWMKKMNLTEEDLMKEEGNDGVV